MIARFTAGALLALSLWPATGRAVVFTYTDESQYLAQLSALGYRQSAEDFEGPAWQALRTTRDTAGHPRYRTAASVASQGITWEAPSYQSPLSTEQRFHRLPGEDAAAYAANRWALTAVTRRTEVDAFAGGSAAGLVGVGGWFDTTSGYKYDEDSARWIPEGHLFVSLDGGVDNDFGAGGDADPTKLGNALAYDQPPRFFGIIDTDGFNVFRFTSDQSLVTQTDGLPGEMSEPGFYGPIVYADRFTFGVAQAVPEPGTWAVMSVGLVFVGLRVGSARLGAKRPGSA